MRVRALVAMLALASAAGPAAAQQATEVTGRELGLIFPIQDLLGKVIDLRFVVTDMAGRAQNIAGQAQNLQVKETDTEIRIELAADVLFDFDKATIRPSAASALHNVADIIRDKAKGRVVRIEGHTDGKGSAAYNQKLSERRADSVRQWLAQKEGLAGARLTTQGFGATRPVAPNTRPDGADDPEGRQKNRRVEIIVSKG